MLTGNFNAACLPNCGGGIANIAILDKCDLDTYTINASGEVSLITLVAGVGNGFRRYDPGQLKTSYKGAVTFNEENNNTSFEGTLTATIDCPDVTAKQYLKQLRGKACCGLVIAFEDRGATLVHGLDKFDKVTVKTVEHEIGQNVKDANKLTVTFMLSGADDVPYLAADFETLPFAP
jgi:hypothetical protein